MFTSNDAQEKVSIGRGIIWHFSKKNCLMENKAEPATLKNSIFFRDNRLLLEIQG